MSAVGSWPGAMLLHLHSFQHKPPSSTATNLYRLMLSCRTFLQLSPSQRSQAVDVLAANLRYICTSVQHLLSDEEPASPETLQRHMNGLKMIVHLLHMIAMQAHKDAEQSKGAENAAAKPAKGAGGRNGAAPTWQSAVQSAHSISLRCCLATFANA